MEQYTPLSNDTMLTYVTTGSLGVNHSPVILPVGARLTTRKGFCLLHQILPKSVASG